MPGTTSKIVKQFNQEFLDSDWRKNRPQKYGFRMTDQKTLHKHQRLLPPGLVKDKTILDIKHLVLTTLSMKKGVDMLCDMCRQGNYVRLLIEANVKSSVYHRVMCKLCGYQTVKRSNVKRDERRFI